jgi:hypothetical protein
MSNICPRNSKGYQKGRTDLLFQLNGGEMRTNKFFLSQKKEKIKS